MFHWPSLRARKKSTPRPRSGRALLRVEQLEDRLLMDGNGLTIDSLVVPASVREGDTASFTAAASNPSGSPISYQWDFGDGTSQSGTNLTDPTHIFLAQPSTPSYNVTLTVTDTSGSVGLSHPVAVSDVAPQVNAGTSATIHAGDTVSFQGTATAVGGSSQLASIQWDFNYNGTTLNPMASGTLTPTHAFATPGTFLVALQATDVSGTASLDVTSVVVKPVDALLVNAGPDQGATPGSAVSFSGNYSYPGGTVDPNSGVAWDFSYNGSTFNPMVTGTLTPSYTFMMPGSYQVALRVSAADGTQDVSVLHVQAANYVGPTATAGADQTVNQGGSLSFAGSFTDPDGSVSSSGIAWDFHYNGATFNPTVTGTLTPGQQFLQSGTQQVALQVTDSHGLSSLRVLNVTVNDVAPTITVMGPSTVSAGDTSSFGAMVSDPGGASDPVAVAWDFAYDGTTFHPGQASSGYVTHTFPTAGSYTVAAQATDSAGLSTLATTTVTVLTSSAPQVSIGADQALTQGGLATFTAAIADAGGTVSPSQVNWDFNYYGGFVADPLAQGTLTATHVFAQPGTFLVAAQATDSNGVTRLGTAYVSVADPGPQANPGSDLTVAEGTAVSFQGSATDVGGSSALAPVQWDFAYDGVTFQADPSAQGTLTPSHTFTAPGDYTVALRATDLWGAVDVETLKVTVTAVPPTATVTNSGPANEGSPVTFTVSNITDVDPQATFSYWAQWSAGAGFTQISPADVMGGGNSASFTHVFDTASGPSGYAVTIRVLDSDGASTDFAQTVVVNAAAPSATFGPSGWATVAAAGLPIVFTNVSDPSNTETQAGFTYHFSVNGGAYVSSSSPQFVLPDYTQGQNDTITGYVSNAEGAASPVYRTSVMTWGAQTVVANQGSGTVLVDGTTVLPGQYLLSGDRPHVTLETSGAYYGLYTNGNFGTVDAAAGVASVNLSVSTNTGGSNFLSAMSPAAGSATLRGPMAFAGNGDIGPILLPGGNAGSGPSTLDVEARGDFGGVTGPGGLSGKLWARASNLFFGNLNGSITGLDSIGTLAARGRLGRSVADQVWANSSIGGLSAYAVPATVTADRNANASDWASFLNVGQGGIASSVSLGNVLGATVGGTVNRLVIDRLMGTVQQQGPGRVTALAFLAAAAPPGGTTVPSILVEGDANKVIGAEGQQGDFAISKIAVGGELGLQVHGTLKVAGNLEAGDLDSLQVSKDLSAQNILVKKGSIGQVGLDVSGNLTVANKIEAAASIKALEVDGNLQAKQIVADAGDISYLGVTGDLTAVVQAPKGIIQRLGVGADIPDLMGGSTLIVSDFVQPDNAPIDPTIRKRILVLAKEIDSITVTGDMGKLGAVAISGVVRAQRIGAILVGQAGERRGGNLYVNVFTRNGDPTVPGNGRIGVVEATRTIWGFVRAQGGNIGLVKAQETKAAIEALRLSATDNTGGSIARVELEQIFAGAIIHADNFLGSVKLTGARPSTGTITAQAGAKFDENNNLMLVGGQAVVAALTFNSTTAEFHGSIHFSYGNRKIPFAFRVQFEDPLDGAPLLNFKDPSLTKTWTVKRTAGADDTVTIQDAVFFYDATLTVKKFVFRGGTKFVKSLTDDPTTEWTIE